MNRKFIYKCFAISFLILVSNPYSMAEKGKKYWDWNKINTKIENLVFKKKKKDFLWGVATSAYQIEGNKFKDEELLEIEGEKIIPQNQWQFWEGKELEKDGKMIKPVPYRSGEACDSWNLYEQDIAKIEELGFNTYRFSVAWEKIEPIEGKFNDKALDHYEDLCKKLVEKGIKPVITLHHYTHPMWFEQKGAFEDSNNIPYFVRFCKKVFARLNKYVHLWFTFNTFSGYAFPGYLKGFKPPFKNDMQLAVEVLKNMLDAHVEVYISLKIEDETAQVGIYKNIFHLDPLCYWNPIERWLGCYFGNQLTNESIYNYFTKGKLKIWIPMKAYINYENTDAIGAFDCVGLNYYSGAYMSWFTPQHRSELIRTTDELYTIYPEGLYRALDEVWQKLANSEEFKKRKMKAKPIFITENGIAPQKEEHRELFFKRHIYAISEAIKDGIGVNGYFVWTLMDNFEWQHGYEKKKYGICEVNFDTQERKVRESVAYLLSVVKEYAKKSDN